MNYKDFVVTFCKTLELQKAKTKVPYIIFWKQLCNKFIYTPFMKIV